MPKLENSFSIGSLVSIGLAVLQLFLLVAGLGYGAAQITQNEEEIKALENVVIPELSKRMQDKMLVQDTKIANNLEIVNRTQGFTGRLEERMEALQNDISELNNNLRRVLNE